MLNFLISDNMKNYIYTHNPVGWMEMDFNLQSAHNAVGGWALTFQYMDKVVWLR